jgi:hypothetical protein
VNKSQEWFFSRKKLMNLILLKRRRWIQTFWLNWSIKKMCWIMISYHFASIYCFVFKFGKWDESVSPFKIFLKFRTIVNLALHVRTYSN